jgi:demethylmenaquinone methyltransferase / 2-methoxy-6-polyprenyl-1,4-benzoquinol methylase
MTLPAPAEKRRAVERMFDRIASRYDGMNRLITLGVDRSWRRRAIASLELRGGERVLDLGCGTGDLALAAAVLGGMPVGLDVAARMLALAARRGPALDWVRGEGEALPFATSAFDAVVTGFALRNLVDPRRTLEECARILRAGGRLAILEVDEPEPTILRLGHRAYFHGIVPWIGRWFSDGDAYCYLPESVAYLPDDRELAGMLDGAGFAEVAKNRLLGGAAQLVTARRR